MDLNSDMQSILYIPESPVLYYLGIFGTIVGLITAIPQIIKFFRRSKPSVIHFVSTNVSLLEPAKKNIDDLNITYKGKELNSNLYVYEAGIANVGGNDIQPASKGNSLKIILSDGYKFHDFQIVKKSKELELDFTKNQDETEIDIKIELLKRGEYFTYSSIIGGGAAPNGGVRASRFDDHKLELKMRAAGLSAIEKIKNLNLKESLTSMIIFGLFLIIVVIAAFQFTLSPYSRWRSRETAIINGREYFMNLNVKNDTTLIVSINDADTSYRITLSQYMADFGTKYRIKVVKDWQMFAAALAVLFAFSTSLLYYFLRLPGYLKIRSAYRILRDELP